LTTFKIAIKFILEISPEKLCMIPGETTGSTG
jgi:hypothetical protein